MTDKLKDPKTYRRALLAALAAAAVAAPWLVGAGAGEVEASEAQTVASAVIEEDIVEVARQAGSFETLLAALEAAGLVETLQGEGPLTVFAPTDAAFEALPEGTVPSLLENQEQLRDVLTYHVVPGRVTAEQVVELDSATTVNGQSLNIQVSEDGTVRVGGATVVQTDVMASNGIIHVIDGVLLPDAED